MTINYAWDEEYCALEDFSAGDVFLHNGVPFIRVQKTDLLPGNDGIAVNLETGELLRFKPYSLVRRVWAELNIE